MEEVRSGEKQLYIKPTVLATYSKDELEDAIRPHGTGISYSGCGCGGS